MRFATFAQASTRLKIVALARIPLANVSTATDVKPSALWIA